MTQTFLVTGGAGFVGQVVCRFLLRKGARVRTLDLVPLDAADASAGIEHVLGDIRDAAAVRRAAEGADVVVHAAAALPLWEPAEIRSINVEGTRTVLQTAAELRIPRVVYISSTAVYGAPGRGPILETDVKEKSSEAIGGSEAVEQPGHTQVSRPRKRDAPSDRT